MTDRVVDGALLREAYEKRLMTQAQLCQRSGVSSTHMKRILGGFQPRQRTLQAIVAALGCDIEEITRPAQQPAGCAR